MSTSDVDVIKQLPTKAAKVVANYRRAVSRTQGKAMLSEREKAEHIEQLGSKASEQIRLLRSEGQQAQSRLSSASGKPTVVGSPSEQLLSETRKERAWSRVKAQLDPSLKPRYEGTDPLWIVREAIDTAVKDGDADAFAALSEELPSYLRTNGMEHYADILPVLLKPGEALSRTASARSADRNAAPGYRRVETALAQAEHAVTHTSPSMMRNGSVPIDLEYVIPDYDDGQIVTIEGVRVSTSETDEFGKPQQTKTLPQLQEA